MTEEFKAVSSALQEDCAPIVEFVEDLESDCLNLYESTTFSRYGHDFSSRMDKNIVELCKAMPFDQAQPKLLKFLQDSHKPQALGEIRVVWRLVEKRFFERLLQITGRAFTTPATGKLTAAPRLNYNFKERWFCVPARGNVLLAPTRIAHELLHFHYHENYEKKALEKLSKNQSETLKESLTFILNEAFQDILVPCDNGYPDHQELRKKLREAWLATKDFDKVIEAGIEAAKAIK